MLAAASALLLPESFFVEQMESPQNRLGRPVEVTSPPAEIARHGRILAAFSALAGHPLIAFAVAGVLSLLFSVLGGGRASYRQYLALAAHALVVLSLGMLLTAPLRALTGDPDAAWSLGTLFPALREGGLAGRTLGVLDLFTLWTLLILAIGSSVLNRFRPWLRTALPLLGLYVALAAVLASVEGGG